MGRFFIILFGDSPLTAAAASISMSAVASGFSILFLFWSITHFARKIVLRHAALWYSGRHRQPGQPDPSSFSPIMSPASSAPWPIPS